MTTIAQTAPTTEPTERTLTVLQKAVCLLLDCGHLGNHRKVDARTLEMKKDGTELKDEKRVLSVSKRLVDADELRACERTLSAAKDYLGSVSVARAHKVFGAGTYLVPRALLLEVMQRMDQFKADLAANVERLVARWPEIVEASRERHGKLFNVSEFPTVDDVRSAFRLEWSYMSFSAPENLEEVDAAVAERAREMEQARLEQAYDEIVVGLREAAMLVMRELAERLRPDADGKPKAIRQTALDAVQDLLGRLPVLNITGDTDLPDALARMQALSEGVTVDALRSMPAVRTMLLQEAERTAEQLEGLVTKGRRAMRF